MDFTENNHFAQTCLFCDIPSMLTYMILLTKLPVKELLENDIEANIEKQRFSELFDNVAVETYGLKNSSTPFPAASCLTKIRI